MGRHQDLIAYREAAALADELHGLVATWASLDQWTLGVQLLRACDSIGANIAEAMGRGTPRDEQRFLLYARGSAHETLHWVERAHARELLEGASYRGRIARIGQLVNGLLRAAPSHDRKSKVESRKSRPDSAT